MLLTSQWEHLYWGMRSKPQLYRIRAVPHFKWMYGCFASNMRDYYTDPCVPVQFLQYYLSICIVFIGKWKLWVNKAWTTRTYGITQCDVIGAVVHVWSSWVISTKTTQSPLEIPNGIGCIFFDINFYIFYCPDPTAHVIVGDHKRSWPAVIPYSMPIAENCFFWQG